MHRLSYKSLFIILLFLLIPIVLLIRINQKGDKVSAAWFDESWGYRQRVDITNPSGSNLTDFQVKISIGTSALITTGKIKNDCSDIRLTDLNGKLLPYWIETGTNSCNTNTTAIWVKITSLPTTNGTIYFYYGNPNAINIQNGDQVFEFFDDFNNNQIDNNKWTQGTIAATSGTNFSESGGNLIGGNTNRFLNSSKTFTGNYIAETRIFETTSAPNGFTSVGFYTSSSNCLGILIHSNTTYIRNDASWPNIGAYTTNQWLRNTVSVVGTNAFVSNTLESTGVGVSTTYTNSGINSEYLRLGPRYDDGAYDQNYSVTWDWIFVRKAISTPPTSTLATEELSPAPIAYWKFNEGVGTSAYDSSSNKNNGLISGATWATNDQCINGKCLYFNGSSSILINNAKTFNSTAYTVSAWVRSVGVTGYQDLISFNNGFNPRIEVSWGQYPLFYFNDGANDYYRYGTKNVYDNKWHNIQYVFNDVGNYIKIFVDGKDTTGSGPNGNEATISSIWKIGTNYNGYIDELKVYPYARTISQIKQDYTAGLAGQSSNSGSSVNIGSKSQNYLSDGLVGYWKMDENIGTTSVDSSGNNNLLTFATGSSAPSWSSGKYGIGISLDGVSTYASIPDNSNLNPTSAITISTWIKTPNPTQSYGMLITKTDANSWQLRFNGNTGKIQFVANIGGIFVDQTKYSTNTVIQANTWYHVVGVYNGNKIITYINGIDDGSYTISGNLATYTNPLSFGKRIDGYFFNGSIDEVRIYNRAFSPTEVSSLFTWAPGPILYYNLEEVSGNTINDLSGNNYNGTAATTTIINGKYGKGRNFNTSGSQISFSPINTPFTWTAMAWAKFPLPTTADGWRTLFSHNGGNYHPILVNSGGEIGTYNTAWYTSSFNTNTLSVGWHHIAAIGDGTTTTFIIDSVNRGTAASKIATSDFSSLGNYSAGGGQWFGSIDEVKIYNYARTPKQITEDMNAGHPIGGSPVGSQIGYWKFDEGSGTTANNTGSIGSTLNSTLGTGTSSPNWTNDGKFNKALSFDGSNDYLVFNNRISLASDFSISSWIKPTSKVTQVIIGTNQNSGGLRLSNSDITFGPNGTYIATWTNARPSNDTWHHIAVSVNRASNLATLFIDGINKGTQSVLNFDWTTLNEKFTYIGKDNCSTDCWFNGLIDEVKVYNSILTDEDIKIDYNNSSSISLGQNSQTIGDTTTSLEYCIPGDTSACSAPIAEWKFEEKNGTTPNDTSGNNNNGTLGSGSASPSWTTGIIGGALLFDGQNDYISTPTQSIATNISVSAWVKSSNFNQNGFIIGKNPVNTQWELFFEGPTLKWRSGGTVGCEISTPAPSNNSWHFVSVTQAGTTANIYIDGVLKNTASICAIANGAGTIDIGRFDSNYYYNGQIDQVRIYNYARSLAQVAYDYNLGAPIGWWKLDECQGNTAFDSSGIGNTGSIYINASGSQTSIGTCSTAGTAWGNGASGKLSSSLNFDGTDDYIQITNPSSGIYNFGTSDFTMSAWTYRTGTGVNIVVGKRVYPPGFVMYYNPDNSITVQINDTSPHSYSIGTPSCQNTWCHLTASVKRSSNQLFFYVNGKLFSTTDISATTGSINNAGWLGVGADQSDTSNVFKGQIDDIRIYNYPLTDTQVKQIYNNGSVTFGN